MVMLEIRLQLILEIHNQDFYLSRGLGVQGLEY